MHPHASRFVVLLSSATLLGALTACEELFGTDEAEFVEGSTPAAPEGAAAGAPTEAAKPARRFLEVEGDVKLDGEAAAVDMEIGTEATIEAGKDGHAVLTIAPGSVIEVRAESKLTFGKSETAESSVKLAFGTLWSFVADGSSYEVVTPNAVAGVRGTVFFVQVAKKKKSYICACHGKLAIQAANKKSFDKVINSPSNDHKSFDIISKGKKQKVKKAKRRNHTDDQKMALMPFMDQVKTE